MKNITRRSFLAILTFIPGLAFPYEKTGRNEALLPEDRQSDWQELVNSVIGPYPSVVRVGLSCTEVEHSHKNSAWTDNFINQMTLAAHSHDTGQINSLHTKYRQRLKEDFKLRRMVLVNGHYLAKTEAEVYQLIARGHARSCRG